MSSHLVYIRRYLLWIQAIVPAEIAHIECLLPTSRIPGGQLERSGCSNHQCRGWDIQFPKSHDDAAGSMAANNDVCLIADLLSDLLTGHGLLP